MMLSGRVSITPAIDCPVSSHGMQPGYSNHAPLLIIKLVVLKIHLPTVFALSPVEAHMLLSTRFTLQACCGTPNSTPFFGSVIAVHYGSKWFPDVSIPSGAQPSLPDPTSGIRDTVAGAKKMGFPVAGGPGNGSIQLPQQPPPTRGPQGPQGPQPGGGGKGM